jgi:DNA-binding beta-propeller fold protein YncE
VIKWPILVSFGALSGAVLAGMALVAGPKLGRQTDGAYLVSTGQRVQLLGSTTLIQGSRPKDMAMSPDRRQVALLTHQRLLVTDLDGRTVAETPITAGPLGVAWSPDGRRVYASLGSGKIGVFEPNGQGITKAAEWAVESPPRRGNPGTGGLAVAANGTVYAALSIRNLVVALGPDGTIQGHFASGACPYHLALSPDGHTLAVANRGGTVILPHPEQGDPTSRGAFQGTTIASANSAGTPVQIDPRTDAALAGTVSLIPINVSGVNQSVTVGRQPSGMRFSADGRTLYVADSDEDALSVVDVPTLTERSRISITPTRDPGFGQVPTDVALSPDGARVYVSLGAANAIAVIEGGKVLGYAPTAWYPLAIAAFSDRLIIACAKGIGSRPSGKTTGFGVHDSVGALQVVAMSDFRNLGGLTRAVARDNGWTDTPGPRPGRAPAAVPERVGEPSLFKHVVYIVKENLCYDIAMGDMKEGNGDPSLCVFPENVCPNHHALARRFGLLDNFYISGTNSADGHQWVDSAIANDYTERNYGANERSYPFDGGDPLAFSPAGFLWSQAKAAGKSVRVFGEFVDKPLVVDRKTGRSPDWRRCWEDFKSGKGEVFARALSSQAALRESLDPTYIGFPMNESDQWRASVFLAQLGEWDKQSAMPDLTIMLLPNDHTGGTNPGWPTPRAYVADNDYALGRIVEGISRSKFWPDTLILVAEDDSQNGLDHVDGHRSIAFCISAYSRGGTIDDMYTHVSIASTIGHVLGIPPMTRFDRNARPMFGCFSAKPDLTPYTVVPNRVPIDEVNPPAKQAGSAEARRLAVACARMDWSKPDIQDDEVVNRAIWLKEAPRSVGRAGYTTVFPGKSDER